MDFELQSGRRSESVRLSASALPGTRAAANAAAPVPEFMPGAEAIANRAASAGRTV